MTDSRRHPPLPTAATRPDKSAALLPDSVWRHLRYNEYPKHLAGGAALKTLAMALVDRKWSLLEIQKRLMQDDMAGGKLYRTWFSSDQAAGRAFLRGCQGLARARRCPETAMDVSALVRRPWAVPATAESNDIVKRGDWSERHGTDGRL